MELKTYNRLVDARGREVVGGKSGERVQKVKIIINNRGRNERKMNRTDQ